MAFQASFLSLAQHKKLRREKFLDEMNAVIPWGEFLRRSFLCWARERKEACSAMKCRGKNSRIVASAYQKTA